MSDSEQATPERIVVGVDGSDNATAAARWAAREAALRGVPLTVLHVWQLLTVPLGYVTEDALDAIAAGAQEVLDGAVALARSEAPGVEVEGKLVQGSPPATMLAEAKDAAMLVVGRRGHGGFAGLLLGSVSNQMVHHPPCPVVVVPGPVDA
ncbi:MAG: universal stress protein [Actinomycetota bacterium]|nr:universal stress protein [Actinomycetota bacterium]